MSSCGCGCKGKPDVALGDVQTGARSEVRQLSTETTWRDTIGGWLVRWRIGRMDYSVKPGLYRVGTPDAESPVLVTANYKLTVDLVRSHLAGLNVWLLVLDTKGINVWCAAGKGTFGTGELVGRIASVGLAGVVKHRNLIVPQLGATGVAAHEVKRATGFSVCYGPVRASDIPAYLAAGMRATPAMRRVRFGWKDRLVLAPVELVEALKPLAMVVAALLALTLVRNQRLTGRFAVDVAPFIAAVLTGGVLVPLLLPWLPSRYFALKGAVAGIVLSMVLRAVLHWGTAETAGTSLLVVAVTSYMAMMFTGATTFTTLAGARLEVRRALPPILASAVIGAVLRGVAIFV
jgi:hypothetical protein